MLLNNIKEDSKILIVDDMEDNIYILEGILQESGYKSFKSTIDSRKVISIYAEYQPDLVLLDLEMPYFTGFEVMRMLKEVEHDSYIPVIVLTARSERETRIKALEAGARDFVVKPFDEVEVETRIRNQLEVRLLHNQIKNQNVILEQKVKERTRELAHTRREVIYRLGIAAEFRDNETGDHILRMSKMCEKLALGIGLGKEMADLMLNGSPMHDIGKIGIPDSILLKPGALNDEEWVVMKKHTEIGGQILSGDTSSLLTTARIIAISHHEKWDGTGYPKGLKGDAIPIEGRIAAIADVFDALTSKRPYKEPWSIEDAVKEINSKSGKHFDPALIEVFNKIIPEFAEIKVKHK